jgi:transposase
MASTRKNYPARFKSEVVLAMLREDAPISELSVKYGVHGKMLQRWKRAALDAIEANFSDKTVKDQKSHDAEIKDLHAKIGQLTVERDFLEDVSARLGLGGVKK